MTVSPSTIDAAERHEAVLVHGRGGLGSEANVRGVAAPERHLPWGVDARHSRQNLKRATRNQLCQSINIWTHHRAGADNREREPHVEDDEDVAADLLQPVRRVWRYR
jgi:hypothetical protein